VPASPFARSTIENVGRRAARRQRQLSLFEAYEGPREVGERSEARSEARSPQVRPGFETVERHLSLVPHELDAGSSDQPRTPVPAPEKLGPRSRRKRPHAQRWGEFGPREALDPDFDALDGDETAIALRLMGVRP